MSASITEEQVRRLWQRGHGLLPPQPEGSRAAAEIAHRVCGLQAQDIFAAGLGVRVRSRGTSLADVDAARIADHSVVWTWAMRGTLHLLATGDLDWLLAAVGPVLIEATRRRRLQLGLDDDAYTRSLRVVCAHLVEHGPATREELGEALRAAGLPAGYPIERHLLYRAALEGLICMGPDRGAKPTFVLLTDWIGRPLERVPAEEGLRRLAGRYLEAYGPATLGDLAAWSGLTIGTLRSGWDAAVGDAHELKLGRSAVWLPRLRLDELEAPTRNDGAPYVRLLPAFDTYLLGHRNRDLILDEAHAGAVNGGGGMISAVILVDGQVGGTWQANRKGKRVNINLAPFAPFSPQIEAGIAAEQADIDRYLGRL